MFGIGSTEFVIILIVALVLIGPSKLPELMKSLGKGLNELRRMSSDVRDTLEREIEKADVSKQIEETQKELFGDADPAAHSSALEAASEETAATQEALAGQAAAPAQAQGTHHPEEATAPAAPGTACASGTQPANVQAKG